MKLLIIYNIENHKEEYVFNGLIEILSKEYSLVLKNQTEVKGVDCQQFSLILIYNVFNSSDVLSHIENSNIPKILICEEFKIYNTFLSYSNFFDKIILIKNQEINASCYLAKVSTEFITYPFRLKKKSKRIKKKSQIQITVALEGLNTNELLVKIAPALNYLGGVDIQVISTQNSFSRITNDNIKIFHSKNPHQTIEESGLVIGNRYSALHAILCEKPVIIVGDYGLGGFLVPETVKRQYNSFFSGRVGGEIGEFIPPKLLVDDIEKVIEMREKEKNKIVKNNKKCLELQQNHLSSTISKELEKIVKTFSQIQNDLFRCRLKFSNDLKIIHTKEGQYIIYQPEMYHIYRVIDKYCFEIIELFKEKNYVDTVMRKTKNDKNKIKFKNTIYQLLNDNILIYYDN